MNCIGNWLRQLGRSLNAGLRSFMTGRYGTDRLNMSILGVSLILCLTALFIRNPAVNLVISLISNALLIWALFRTFSRNTYRRYLENSRFLQTIEQIKDRKHRYFNCPKCHQRIRVPRGKGKISITCPKCREKFVKKT